MASPSCVEVPLPSSSMMTRDLSVADAKMSLVSESSCSGMHGGSLTSDTSTGETPQHQDLPGMNNHRRLGYTAILFLTGKACAELSRMWNCFQVIGSL